MNNEFGYAAAILAQLARRIRFRKSLGLLRPLPSRQSHRRFAPNENPAALSRGRRDPQHLRHPGIQRRPAARAIASSTSRAIPASSRSRSTRRSDRPLEYLGRHHALFTFGENIGTESFPVPTHNLRWLPTRQPVVTDLWRTSRAPAPRRRFHFGRQLVHERPERHRVARRKISLEQIARVPPFRRRAEKRRRDRSSSRPTSRTTKRARNSSGTAGVSARPHDLSVDYGYTAITSAARKASSLSQRTSTSGCNTGWFSDRSACYLAAGRPVITQETGFTESLRQRRRPFRLPAR